MSDTNPNNPPATTLDMKALGEVIASQVATAIKPIGDALAGVLTEIKSLGTSRGDDKKDAGKTGEAEKPLTAADVAKLIADSRAKDVADAAQVAKTRAAREAAIKTHLTGVPDVYHSRLPDTDNAAALEAAAKKAGEEYRSHLAAAGVKAPTIGAQPAAGATAAGAAVDTSKLNPVAKIATGYAQTK